MKFSNKQIVDFLSFWAANTVSLLVLSMILASGVVLGNATVSAPLAAIASGLILTLVMYATPIAVDKAGMKKTLDKNPSSWAGAFLVANFLAVWVIKRFAEISGFGVSSLLYVLVVAIVLTLVGWGVAKVTGAMSPKK